MHFSAFLLGMTLTLGVSTSAFASHTVDDDKGIAMLRALLAQPEDRIDLARAKITIDHIVDPSMDVEATLKRLNGWADRTRARFPVGASNKQKMEILVSTLYEPGPWNDDRPFGYDYSDPYGGELRNTMLSTYLETRKGQCISMPIAVVAIGQKLGLDVTMTTAPYHLMVKYGDEEQGTWMNLEATSGRFYPDSDYERSLQIPPHAVEQETFLRPHTRRESVALFATATLAAHYRRTGQAKRLLEATELILDTNPGDVVAMTFRGDAHQMLRDRWFAEAAKRGWKEWQEADWARYLEHFAKKKSEDGN